MRARESRRKNILIVALLGILVLLGIAYAAFSSNLNITGTSNTTNNWNVRITNIRGVNECTPTTLDMVSNIENKVEYIPNTSSDGAIKQMAGHCVENGASDITAPTKSVDGLSATFNTGLVQPGDARIYEVEVTNAGSLDAVVSHTLTNNSSNPAIEITYDGYSATPILTENEEYDKTSLQTTEPFDLLKGNGKKYIYITVKYSESVVSQPNGLNAQATITLNATQKESSSSVGPNTDGGNEQGTTFTGTIYRYSSVEASNGDTIVAGTVTKWCPIERSGGEIVWNGCEDDEFFDSEADCNSEIADWSEEGSVYSCEQGTIPTGIGEYTTDVSTLNKNVYLKHDVVDNIITASYACFVNNNTEYCLEGGDEGTSFAANRSVIETYQTLYSLPNNANPSNQSQGCKFDASQSICYGGNVGIIASNSMGVVGVGATAGAGCGINDVSSCIE